MCPAYYKKISRNQSQKLPTVPKQKLYIVKLLTIYLSTNSLPNLSKSLTCLIIVTAWIGTRFCFFETYTMESKLYLYLTVIPIVIPNCKPIVCSEANNNQNICNINQNKGSSHKHKTPVFWVLGIVNKISMIFNRWTFDQHKTQQNYVIFCVVVRVPRFCDGWWVARFPILIP